LNITDIKALSSITFLYSTTCWKTFELLLGI